MIIVFDVLSYSIHARARQSTAGAKEEAREGKGQEELAGERIWCSGHRLGIQRAETIAPKGLKRCHNYNSTLNVNCAFHLTRTSLLPKIILGLTPLFEVNGASMEFSFFR